MDVAFFGNGPIGERCFDYLKTLPINILPLMSAAAADLWISVHWRHIFKPHQIAMPKMGIVNVHNSFLPWNRGAHACTWAIIDQTPHGATMHWIDEGIDTGPILYQERVDIAINDTADSLYRKTAEAEYRVFRVGMGMLLNGERRRIHQTSRGSFHKKSDFERLVRAMTTKDCKVIREV